jgi:signal transduction histidine kinase
MTDGDIEPDLPVYLASSVHDMKNSISVLIDFLHQTLADLDPATFPRYREMTQMLYETQRVNSNLIQLLALFKVGHRLYPFDPSPQLLDDFVTEIVSQNALLFQFKGIAIEVDYDEDLYWTFDEHLVAGVVNHALNNATHYTKDKVRVAAHEVDGYLELRVEDNGTGYPPAMLEDGLAVMRGVDFVGGGTGLGLHFSAVVAKLHKARGRAGSIHLENGGKWGGGCFVLRLP